MLVNDNTRLLGYVVAYNSFIKDVPAIKIGVLSKKTRRGRSWVALFDTLDQTLAKLRGTGGTSYRSFFEAIAHPKLGAGWVLIEHGRFTILGTMSAEEMLLSHSPAVRYCGMKARERDAEQY